MRGCVFSMSFARLFAVVSAMVALGFGWSAGDCLAEETYELVEGVAEPAKPVITPELIEAHQAYRMAKLRLQQYRFVDLPRQRRRLDDQVRLLELEVRVLKRRLRDYRPFLQVGRYSPVRNASEDYSLVLEVAEQELRKLKNERIELMRFSRQNARIYELEVLRRAAQVRQAMLTPAASLQ